MSQVDLGTSTESNQDGLDGRSKKQLLQQIAELQDAVNDMKLAFTSAVQQLGTIQYDDQSLREKVEQNKTESQDQIAEVIKLMLSLKAEFAAVKCQVQQLQDAQLNHQQQFQGIILEQDLLIDELYKTGSVSEQIRQRLLHSHRIVGRASSGTQSNDSGIALLLEKAHVTFHPPFSYPTPSEQDSASVSEHSPVLVSSMVHDYVAGLGQLNNCDPEVQNNNYDSDSSLVIAANKSLSLSTSLGKQCGLELDHIDSSEDESEGVQDVCNYDNVYSRKCREKAAQMKMNSAIDRRGISDSSKHNVNFTDYRGNKIHQTYNQNVMKMKSGITDKHYRQSQRLRVTRDILETERKYCKMLWTLQDTFAEPMKRNGILSANDVNTIFPEEVYKLYEKHCMLLHKLEERFQAWKWHGVIGDILIKFIDPDESDVLRLYTSYVNDFPEVLKTFHKLCRQSVNFTKFLKTCLEHPNCGGLDLGSFLLTPVQRIPHYILFLKQILKYTDVEHPDFNYITMCLQRLRDFLMRLNDSMEHSFQLVTAQMSPQPEVELPSTLPKCTKPGNKQLHKDVLRNSVEQSFDNEIMDLPSEDDDDIDEEDSSREEFIESRLQQTNRSASKESLGSERDRGLYKKSKFQKTKVWGSQESLKGNSSGGKGQNCLGRASPPNCSSGSLSGSCRAKLRSRSRSESIVSTSSLDFLNCPRNCCEGSAANTRQRSLTASDGDSYRESYCTCRDMQNLGAVKDFNIQGGADLEFEQCSYDISGHCTKLQHISENDDLSEDEVNSIVKASLCSLSGVSKAAARGNLPPSKSMQDVKTELLRQTTIDDTCSEPDLSDPPSISNTNNAKNLIICLEHGNSLTSISESPCATIPDTFSSYKSSPVRQLMKAHSAHAVHQVVHDQREGVRDEVWTAGAQPSGKKCKVKPAKPDKKKVSLRTLKSILFFKRSSRHNPAALKAVDIGTCTSHDELLSEAKESQSGN